MCTSVFSFVSLWLLASLAENGTAGKKARHASLSAKAIVLDIEGTIAPLSYVKEELFPYARQHLKEHLDKTFHTEETQADINVLISEVYFWHTEFWNTIEVPCIDLSAVSYSSVCRYSIEIPAIDLSAVRSS